MCGILSAGGGLHRRVVPPYRPVLPKVRSGGAAAFPGAGGSGGANVRTGGPPRSPYCGAGSSSGSRSRIVSAEPFGSTP